MYHQRIFKIINFHTFLQRYLLDYKMFSKRFGKKIYRVGIYVTVI